ncbi:MAG: diphosphomevalonate decarboxylase [Nitrososphaera sp.]
MISTAISHPNKAIVIYWGNEDDRLNIPSRVSLSMTLRGINQELDYTVTIKTSKDAGRDKVIIDGHEDKGEIYNGFVRHLDSMREYTGLKDKLVVATKKTFPIGSGLAGSAAAASALAEAFAGLFHDRMDKDQISRMARRGSGSAARSVFGGYVKLQKGNDDKSFAVQLWDEGHWDLRDVIAIVDSGPKRVRSRDGMRLSTQTCPAKMYSEFVAIAAEHLKEAGDAIASRELERLGRAYEQDNLFFRKVCMNTTPPLDYWSAATVDVFDAVKELRMEGVPVFAGTDAGPNAHILVEPRNAMKVIDRIQGLEGVKGVIHSRPGGGSHRLQVHLL